MCIMVSLKFTVPIVMILFIKIITSIRVVYGRTPDTLLMQVSFRNMFTDNKQNHHIGAPPVGQNSVSDENILILKSTLF